MLLPRHMLASVAFGEPPFWSGGRALGGRILPGSLGTAWLKARRERLYTLEGDDQVYHPALGLYIVQCPLDYL